jgi:hypothetical protein
MTFLDNPDPQRLSEAKVMVVPFPFALKDSEVRVIEDQARSGKTVLLMSELSPVDKLGQGVTQPRLARLFGNRAVKPHEEANVEAVLGKGKVIFLGGDFAVRLFEEIKPVKGPMAVVPLPAFDKNRTDTLEKILATCIGKPLSLFAQQPEQDIEATCLEGPRGLLLLLINWDSASPSKVHLRLPAGTCEAEGYSILRDATVRKIHTTLSDEPWVVELQPQEARLLEMAIRRP